MRKLLVCFVISVLMSFPCYAGNTYGEYIDAVEVNPRAIPMFDGYTKPETKSTYFVDYSRFWGVNGLGDFTNLGALNSVSREFASNVLDCEGSSIISRIDDACIVGGYWTAEERLCVALPPGAIINPVLYEPYIDELWGNEQTYTDTSWWTKGAPALSYVPTIFDKRLLGMHVDCILDDGVVLPLILTDVKALHRGVYNNDLCNDALLDGYGHWRGDAYTGKKSYLGILEVCISEDYKAEFENNKLVDLHLNDNKIAGFRCYPETCGRFYK